MSEPTEVMSPEERRARNRRRWKRRQQRRLLALLLLLPMIVGAGILSTNVVSVLGHAYAGYDVLERPRTVRTGASVRGKPLHDRVPVLLPVPDTSDLIGGQTVRVTEPLPQRYYEPGSHISPRVKWKLSQLRSARGRADRGERIALASHTVQPTELNTVRSVFRPTTLEVAELDLPLDQFWEVERLYIEATPGGGELVGGAPIPEPGTGVLMSIGLFALAARRRAQTTRLPRR